MKKTLVRFGGIFLVKNQIDCIEIFYDEDGDKKYHLRVRYGNRKYAETIFGKIELARLAAMDLLKLIGKKFLEFHNFYLIIDRIKAFDIEFILNSRPEAFSPAVYFSGNYFIMLPGDQMNKQEATEELDKLIESYEDKLAWF